MKQFAEVEAIINEHESVKITGSLGLAWQAFKRQPGPYIGFMLVAILVSVVVSFIPFANNFVSPFIMLGFAAFVFEENVHKEASFNNFFKPFQKFPNVILTFLLVFVAFIVAFSPFFFFGGSELIKEMLIAQKDPINFPYNFHPVISNELMLGSMVSFVLLMITAVLLNFSIYFAFFYSVRPMEAVKLSIHMGTKNFLHILMLLIFSFIIIMLGIVALIIGILVAVPLVYLMMYYTFARITRLETGTDPEFDFEKK